MDQDTPDYRVEIGGMEGASGRLGGGCAKPEDGGPSGRPWLAVEFACCGVYNRVYRNQEGTAYEGRCPRCGRPVLARIGPGGTANRFFRAE